MLGLSTTLIQSLVDKNELQGWKTRGGHRRISLQSIHEYQTNARMLSSASPRRKSAPQIMVAVESPETLNILRECAKEWGFPVNLKFIDSVTGALLQLASERPDLLVVELSMPKAQQEKTLLALQDFNSRGRPISMVLLTEERHLHSSLAGSPNFIQIAPGPMSEIWLHAYLTGVVATCQP